MGKTKSKKHQKKTTQPVRKPKALTRKEQRKEQRKLFKQEKHIFHMKKHGKTLPEISADGGQNKPENKVDPVQRQKEKDAKKKEKDDKLKKAQEKQRKLQMEMANHEEEQTIKKLEKQLKLNKRKTKGLPAAFKEDGLDYLLDVLDADNLQRLGSDDESDMENAFLKGDIELDESGSDHEDDQDMGQEDESDEQDHSDLEAGEEQEDFEGKEEDEGEEETMDEDSEVEDQNKRDGKLNENSKPENAKESESEKSTWEDIYGRTRDSEGNVVKSTTATKYVPPALRAQAAGGDGKGADAVALAKLSKQVKGALNRLAESNMHVIARQIEDLYMSNSRNLMNECLCQILTNSLISTVLTPERLVMDHALLISVLHANIGTEVGANILQTMISKYVDLYANTDDHNNIDSKLLDNYLQLVGQMYAFQIVGHELMFDILDGLSNSFKAKDVELILLILRSVGFLLRKDNPTRLKSLILKVQKMSNEMEKTKENTSSLSRVQFMLEIVLAIKNNNVKKIPKYDPTHQAHLQKISKTFLRPGCSVTPLNVRMDDLTSADTRGRWWIVGSAWAGKNAESSSKQSTVSTPVESKFSAKLLEMARKMRMNTEARRNLFCALMSADDYLDAFERLVKVDKAAAAAGTRERDTAFVLLTCCLKEPAFNPFYSQLAIKLGGFDRKYRMAVQCCIWDRIKDIASLKKHEQNNLAKFASHLVKDKLLSLTCLKVIEFSELNKNLVKFIKHILLDLMSEPDQTLMAAPFLVVAGYPKLSTFRDGLRLFMRHFMLRKSDKDDISKEELKAKIEIADKALMAGEKRLAL